MADLFLKLPHSAPGAFGPDRLARLEDIEGRHFWFAGRRARIERLLTRYAAQDPILDLGCGTGSFAESLAERGRRVVALDARPEGLRSLRRRARTIPPVQASATHLPLRGEAVRTVLLADVLEHVDEAAALREVRRVLEPGGCAVISVPAMPWLWSYRDEAAGHLRRYTRAGLKRLVLAQGMQVEEIGYFQFFLFPVLAAGRLLRRRSVRWRDLEDAPPPLVNRVLTWIARAEAALSGHIAWPFGSSLLAVCRKPCHEP
jgi:SAM-dependent methyltransferase